MTKRERQAKQAKLEAIRQYLVLNGFEQKRYNSAKWYKTSIADKNYRITFQTNSLRKEKAFKDTWLTIAVAYYKDINFENGHMIFRKRII